MNWTIGIVTDSTQDQRLQIVLDSIYKAASLTEDAYEVIVCGNTKIQTCKVIPFDESVKPGWITKKKNLIAHFAKYKNLILMHDYIAFDDNWFAGWHRFGPDVPWDVCMMPMANLDGSRFRDWTLWPPRPIPYDDWTQTKNQYISGGFYAIRKQYALANPLDESLVHCAGEDVEFSLRVRDTWDYKCNVHSTVRLLKYKDTHYR